MAPMKHAVGNGLVAVLFVTRSKPGPKLVFHYPEIPSTKQRHRRHSIDTDDSATDTEGEEDAAHAAELAKVRHDGQRPAKHLLGRSVESLEKLLSPGRWSDGKKFEVCLDGLTFIGHPIYALEDGKWTVEVAESTATAKPTTKLHYGEYHMYLDPGSVASSPPDPGDNGGTDFEHMPDSLDSNVLGTSMESTSTSSGRAVEQIAMFHIVFVVNSRGAMGQHEVGVVYREVAKKLSMALHYLQKQSNYVAAESRRLLSLKMKAKQKQRDNNDLWQQLVETSELAWALKEIYEKIYVGEVAGIRLNGMEMSLRADDTRLDTAPDLDLTPLSALLLLEAKEELLHQLSHPEASPLAHFIRGHAPTKTLQKHAINLGIPINDILYLTHHLVKWRKAQVIAPLHQRNTYVAGPRAPLDQLHTLIEKYSKAFPTLPSLPNMLKILSGKPIKYGLLIPSRDHRGAYMDILSFLVQHNLVVQLKTSGWLHIPKSLLHVRAAEELDPNKRPMSVRALLSPRLRPVEDDEASVSSERTAIPAALMSKASKRLSSGTQISLNSASAHTHSTSQDKGATGAVDECVLIISPTEATPEEAHLIAALTRSLTSAEMREHFPEMVKFLDGETAFEQIAARIGLKRAKVEEWLNELEGRGLLLSVRYI